MKQRILYAIKFKDGSFAYRIDKKRYIAKDYVERNGLYGEVEIVRLVEIKPKGKRK